MHGQAMLPIKRVTAALLCSAIVPGLGHIALGRFKTGFLVATAQGLSAVGILWSIFFIGVADLDDLLYLGVLLPLSMAIYALSLCSVAFVALCRPVDAKAATYKAGYIFLLAAIVYLPAIFVLAVGNYFLNGPAIGWYRKLTLAYAPAIFASETFLVWRNYYVGRQPEAGHLVVFRWGFCQDSSIYKETMAVMRIVGVPGDKISIASNAITINGQTLVHSPMIRENLPIAKLAYTLQLARITESLPNGRSYEIFQRPNYSIYGSSGPITLVVPDRHYFVLHDNRSDLIDSREEFQQGIADCKVRRTRFVSVDRIVHRPTMILTSDHKDRIGKRID